MKELHPRFPLTAAWTSGALGLNGASPACRVWSLVSLSKPWQLFRVKSKGWKVVKVGGGVL